MECKILEPVMDSWESPDKFPALAPGELHIWRCHIDSCDPDNLESSLSSDEVARANRFYFTKDRKAYVISRGTLRTLLGKYLQCAPSVIAFEYSAYGKPSLTREFRKDLPIEFNLSHSSAFSLFAFTLDQAVGVDLEFMRPNVIEEQIAERFFSADETKKLRSLPKNQQVDAFFRCWTRKESFIKGRGDGLSLPLDQFDVTLCPAEPAALLRTRFDPSVAPQWSLQHLNIEPGYAAAVAVHAKAPQIKLFSLY